MFQLQQRLEEVPFAVAEVFHIGERLAAADHTAKPDRQHIDQAVTQVRVLRSRVVDLTQVAHERSGLHHGLLAAAESGPH